MASLMEAMYLLVFVCSHYHVPVECCVGGGSFRLIEPAFTWSTIVNTSSSVEKCTRKALMMLWEREKLT